MGKLANIARNVLGAGGEYISLDNIIKKYPEGLTINGAFIRAYEDGNKIPCFTFVEDANKYFYAISGDVARLYDNWLNNCDNSIDELAESLRYENVKIKIEKKRTKSNKTYTKAWVIDVIENPRVEVEAGSAENIDPETGEILSEDVPF